MEVLETNESKLHGDRVIKLKVFIPMYMLNINLVTFVYRCECISLLLTSHVKS